MTEKDLIKALDKNTLAIKQSTAGLGRWEKKDEQYHKEHHKILLKMLEEQRSIWRTLKNKEVFRWLSSIPLNTSKCNYSFMEFIEDSKGKRTHEIRIIELKTNKSKSFSIKTKKSLKIIFVKLLTGLKQWLGLNPLKNKKDNTMLKSIWRRIINESRICHNKIHWKKIH